ncbi:hypothetical protein [Oceanobacillus caeni]
MIGKFYVKLLLQSEGTLMWVITVYEQNDIHMFEFNNQEEANEAFKNMKGCKYLSEVIYYNDFDSEQIEEAYLHAIVS